MRLSALCGIVLELLITMDYIPTIGLEIHAELKTKSKMFCGCANRPDYDEPNTHICPVCMAHPGTLPVINKEAVRHVLRVGVAVEGKLADFTEFDRKNYFYPDIPKNYQISQYKYPLVSGGKISGVTITRIHLEEDTARSQHDMKGSNVDFSRAGVPLMELVTDPVIHDAYTAVQFAKELRLLLQYLEAGDANLEKGEMRIEANISIAKKDNPLGTKVEVKNLNSFKAVEQAIAYEIKRQTEVIEKGGCVAQETRGWDEDKQKTFSQRIKEESHDYRYYPDPDLPKIYVREVDDFNEKILHQSLPELPAEMRKRYTDEGMQEQTIHLLVGNRVLNSFFQGVKRFLKEEKEYVLASNYITTDVLGMVTNPKYEGKPIEELNCEEFAKIIELVYKNAISSRGAKDIIAEWVVEGGDPEEIAKRLEILQISDTSLLREVIVSVLEEHKTVVDEYKSGKQTAIQYLVGQGMKATKGAANPTILLEIIEGEIGEIKQ